MRSTSHDNLTYFEYPVRKARSTSSSSAVSPNTSIGQPALHSSSRLSRPVCPRAISDQPGQYRKIKVYTIEENEVSKFNVRPSDTLNEENTQFRRPDNESAGSHDSIALSDGASITSSPAPSSKYFRFRGPSDDTGNDTQSVGPLRRPRPGRKWSRTQSGGVWYEKLKTSSGHSNDSVASSYKSHSVPQSVLTPLAPPKARINVPEQVYNHHVKVETSFTDSKDRSNPSSGKEANDSCRPLESRRSSIHPLHIFSAPLQLARKISQSRRLRTSQNPIAKVSSFHKKVIRINGEMLDHTSLLKRNHTAEALQRVTSILREGAEKDANIPPTAVIHPLNSRTTSDRSNSSKISHTRKTAPTKNNRATISPPTNYNRTSLQDLSETASDTSSIRDLRLGAQPNNTPDERATYKVKRSPSAETEEFLKVDISIRDGTSYLPSEARRIHTPPLPQEGANGKRRGFFFDYNAPQSHDSVNASVLNLPLRKTKTLDRDHIPQRSTSRAATISKYRSGSQKRKASRPRKRDWYDAKLAELDSSDGEGDDENTITRTRTASTLTHISDIRKHIEAQQLDLTIPEHLPNSPLCPRHPKYWRVVDKRGSQFRGCWMHGIGLDERFLEK